MTDYYNDYDGDGYLESKPFKAFEIQVLSVIASSIYPLCTREIKAIMGDACIERWLQDALDRLKLSGVEAVGILPTRYAMRDTAARKAPAYSWAETSARLFPNRTRFTDREAINEAA